MPPSLYGFKGMSDQFKLDLYRKKIREVSRMYERVEEALAASNETERMIALLDLAKTMGVKL